MSLLSLAIQIISVSSTSPTPWATLVIKGKAYRLGLWTQYSCDQGICTSMKFGDPIPLTISEVCASTGTQAGVIMIVAIIMSLALFGNRLVQCCSPEESDKKWQRIIMVVKTLACFALPIISMVLWTSKCYNPLKNSSAVVSSDWGVGLGIIIAAIVVEFAALFGFTAIWKKDVGTEQERKTLLRSDKAVPPPPPSSSKKNYNADLESGKKGWFSRKK
jgi:amino acid transporter